MIAYLVGTRHVNFRAEDGKDVVGERLYISYPEDGVEGEMGDSLFLREGFPLPAKLSPGDTLDITYNRRGKPEKITVVSDK